MYSSVLVVEDDPFVERVLQQSLQAAGLSVHLARTGCEALSKARKLCPAAIVLDLGLPDISGHDVFRALRQDPASQEFPILVLTGSHHEKQELEMLLAGADDYVTKPFDVEVLVTRIRNLLRRTQRNSDLSILQIKNLWIDPRNRIVRWDDHSAATLSPKEFDIFFLLAKDYPNVVDRRTIANRVWGEPADVIHPRSIDVHIQNIRSKLKSASHVQIESLSRKGYRLIIC